jgi:hypothetical protein
MSSKKFRLKDLSKWRRLHFECIDVPFDHKDMPFPVNWHEFNNMFSSKQNVIVECPSKLAPVAPAMMAGFYAGIKLAKCNIKIGMCRPHGNRHGFPEVCKFAKKLSNKNMDENVLFTYYPTPFNEYKNRVLECDEWIMSAEESTYDWSNIDKILKIIHDTRGFSELDVNKELYTANRTLVGWEDKDKKRIWNRKFVITWMDKEKRQLDEVIEKYPNQFLVIPYTKEKRMVDEWYAHNETMVDPGFDIQLMDGSLDKRQVLLYAATNHLYDFRLFAKVLPDVVGKYITKHELKELGV